MVKFRKENKLTRHELNDITSMQLVPSIINSKFGHLGGVSEVKKLLELLQ
ncbi:HNH endonuclease [Streptococcus australis]